MQIVRKQVISDQKSDSSHFIRTYFMFVSV